MNLTEWARHSLRVVDQDGTAVYRVRLLVAEDTWQTWYADEIKRDDWIDSANEVLNGIADGLANGRHQIEFVAEDRSGSVRSRHQASVQGRGGQRAGKANDHLALVQSVEAVARSVKQMLELQQQQLEAYHLMQKRTFDENQRLLEENQRLKEDAGDKSSGLEAFLLEQVGPHIGPVLQVMPEFLQAVAAAKRGAAVPMVRKVS